MNPFTIGPSLVLRALDDLHAIAGAAAGLAEAERRLNERLAAVSELGERIEALISNGLVLGASIRDAGEQIASLSEGVDSRLEEVLAVGERIVALGDRVDQIDSRAEEIMAAGDRVEGAAQDVATVGRQIADALPVLQRAITMAEPLEGAVERLGRIVDRLPRGMRGRGGA